MTNAQLLLGLGVVLAAVAVTLLLFVSGLVISGPVHRMMLSQLREVLDGVITERDYYRVAAQDCAAAVAESQAQNAVMMAAMQRWQGGP